MVPAGFRCGRGVLAAGLADVDGDATSGFDSGLDLHRKLLLKSLFLVVLGNIIYKFQIAVKHFQRFVIFKGAIHP